jgi:Fe-S-cluster containining protein
MDDEIKSPMSIIDEIPFAEAISARETLCEGEAPEATLKLAASAAKSVDGSMLKILNQLDRKPDCQKGCSYCCHVFVEVTIPEVLAIAHHIGETFTPQEREVLLQSIDAAIKETEGMPREKRYDARVPCPLLRDGSCSVYDVRPLPCRSYHSFDVETCKRDFAQPSARHTVDYNRIAIMVGASVASGMSVALTSERLDGRTIELARGLKVALEGPSLLGTWRSSPHAFDGAVMSHAHPSPSFDRANAKRQKDLYRAITNSPRWKSHS